MSAKADLVLAEYQAVWEATGQRGRLEVSRSGYDEEVVSWEVLYPESGSGWCPIAEFTTWAEAQAWAIANAGTGERCLCDFDGNGTLRARGCPVHPPVCSCWPGGLTPPERDPDCEVHSPAEVTS